MRVTGFVTAAALVFSAAIGVYAQAPNLTGKWTLVPAAAPADAAAAPAGGGGRGGGRGGGGGGNPFGQEFTATQDATSLVITRMQGDATVTATYKLDGSESKNMVPGRGGETEQVSKATVVGTTIVITTSINAGGNTIEQKRVLSMDAGGNLVVEQTAPGRGGGEPTTTKITYKKG